MNLTSHTSQLAIITSSALPNSNTNTTEMSPEALLAIGLIIIIIAVISYVIYAILLGRIFQKAGLAQWIAWVPVYNNWKMLEIGNQQGFWAVLAFIPVVNYVALVFNYIAMFKIGLKLGKQDWFILLGIFVPIVWYIWLAFDDSKWNENIITQVTTK